MKSKPITLTAITLVVALIFSAVTAPDATFAKANNADALNLPSSWANRTNVPGTADTALWDNTVTAPNTVALGGDTTWSRLTIADPGGDVTISAGNTLTINNNNTTIQF